MATGQQKRLGWNKKTGLGATFCLALGAAACGWLLPTQAPLSTVATAQAEVQDTPAKETLKVLVFSKTAGFRHGSIGHGADVLKQLGQAHGFETVHSEDASIFSPEGLKGVDVVVFLCTTGDILDENQQKVFERYIQHGGGFVGIHAATDTEYDWAWYTKLVGGQFASHPHVQEAALEKVDHKHMSTEFLPDRWMRTDEWYNFKNYNKDVHLLLTLDETSYEGGQMNGFHPAAWCHIYDGGRAWYTAGGHTNEAYDEPLFQAHVVSGIFWAAGQKAVPNLDTDALPAE